MRKNIQRKVRGFCCAALAVVMAFTGVPTLNSTVKSNSTVVAVAKAASTTGRVPMWAYMKSGSGKLKTYTSNSLQKTSGYIVPGDYCKITAFYSNGSVKVTYPTSRGKKTAYAAMSGFMASTGFSTRLGKMGKRLTAYRRSTGSAAIGTVYAQDFVMIIGRANGRTQVQYPCSGGYKLGWVSGNYSIATPAPTANLPQGYLDSVTSTAAGKITVRGWAFDRDSINSNLQIHVYVGGPAGSGAPGYVITANAYRPDVQKVYPKVGNYHGFDATISVARTGTQPVYVYAINVGGGNSNPLLGSKNVNILGGSAGTSAAVNLNVPSYKQYDTRWKNTRIGTKTIGNIGCLLTGLSMKYSYQTGTAVYPDAMKSKLRFSNNDLYWSSVSALGYSYTGNYGCSINNSIMRTIYNKLKEGKPVIIGGRRSNGSTHWVLIKGYQGSSSTSFSSSNFMIHDPNSSSRTNLNQFLASFPTVLRLVY